MEFISWLLDHLPYPLAVTLAIVGLWATGVKIFAGNPWRTVFLSKLFIFPSLACVYTLVLSIGLINYTKFVLLPVEIDKRFIKRTNPTSFEAFTKLQTKVSTISLTFKKQYLKESRAELYEILNLMEDFRAKKESIPNSFFKRKAELKGRID